MTQLALDVYAADRRRPPAAARIAEHLHRRGWITMPYASGMGRAGIVVPAWVCCRCGDAETSAYLLHISHGCCFVRVSSCTDADLPDGHWSRQLTASWTPHHPQGRPA